MNLSHISMENTFEIIISKEILGLIELYYTLDITINVSKTYLINYTDTIFLFFINCIWEINFCTVK